MDYTNLGYDKQLYRKPSDLEGEVYEPSTTGTSLSSSNPVSSDTNAQTANQVATSLPGGSVTFDKLAIKQIGVEDYISSKDFVSGVTGWRIHGNGDCEFNSGDFRGTLTAAIGSIGGWTIDATGLYHTGTGDAYIKTAETVASGSDGVILDQDGLRGYSATLGEVFNLPTDGSQPSFSSGIIESTIFEIDTSAVLRTSTNVGDGTADSAGVLINSTGIYACEANQELASANLKALIDGTISISGEITSTSGTIGGWTLGTTTLTGGDSDEAILSSTGYMQLGLDENIVRIDATDANYRLWVGNTTAASAPFRVSKEGALTATGATITGAITATSGTLGGITSATITVGSSGWIKGGQTAYDQGTGFFLGYTNDTYKLSIGDSAGDKLLWTGTELIITGTVSTSQPVQLNTYATVDLPEVSGDTGFNSPSSTS